MTDMKFREVFGTEKPVIGMIHTGMSVDEDVFGQAKKEIEIYLKYGVVPLIENYFGSAEDCETVLKWIQSSHPDSVYGLNILGNYPLAFELAAKYGAKFIQIDSVCGHLEPEKDEDYAESLRYYRNNSDAILLGGVRFKYQPVRSGRTTKEDLQIAMGRCDAIVCTGSGTGQATPLQKVAEFKSVVGDFPVIVGAGVTIDTADDTFNTGDGAIIGSWFKYGHQAHNAVNPAFVKDLITKIRE